MQYITLKVEDLQNILIPAVNNSIGKNIVQTANHIKEKLIKNGTISYDSEKVPESDLEIS